MIGLILRNYTLLSLVIIVANFLNISKNLNKRWIHYRKALWSILFHIIFLIFRFIISVLKIQIDKPEWINTIYNFLQIKDSQFILDLFVAFQIQQSWHCLKLKVYNFIMKLLSKFFQITWSYSIKCNSLYNSIKEYSLYFFNLACKFEHKLR